MKPIASKSFWKNKKVLITGHTGFKGSWLSLWLHKLGANVYGISNNIPTEPSHFNDAEISEIVEDLRPSGALEIRKATYEFDKMMKRINRHLVQR